MTLPHAYAPFRAFVAPARDGSPPWRVAAGLALAELAFWFSPLLLVPVFGEDLFTALEGRTALSLALSLALYGVPAAVLAYWVRHRHGRSGWTMIGPPAAAWADLRRAGAGVLLVLAVTTLLMPAYGAADVIGTRPVAQWALTLPLALLAVLIQSGSEEIVFRGYLQQHLGALSDRPIVWMGVPSLLFGMLHYWNAMGSAEGLVYVGWAVMLGMACADLTARTGNIGAAVGLHTANNLVIFALFGMQDGPDSGFALFLVAFAAPEPGPALADYPVSWLMLDLAFSALFILVLWLGARVAVRR